MNQLINADCFEVLPNLGQFDCVFADPPDNIGLGYNEYSDRMSMDSYEAFLDDCITFFTASAPIVWISFNAKWTHTMGHVAYSFLKRNRDWELKPCVQVFTFGQHRNEDLGNNHRPLWRFKHRDAPLYPEAIKVPSWRQRNGDKRAKPGGRVPGDVFDMQYPEPGDVFDFPRVTGNSKQRCDWHPTQLHEDLVKRCLLLSTVEGASVLDPFGGTGTTLRVCRQLNRSCTLVELDATYCAKIAAEHADCIAYDKAA